MRADILRLFPWMVVFFIAMAFLESAVVVYLRALYYPGGFDFPLVPMDPSLVGTEVIREVATMVMLLAPGALVTKHGLERFAWFCFGFGVWDLFYYVWLKVLLDWPASLEIPDLLFLIPVPWVGPVWAPCMISLGLVALALILLRGRSNGAVQLLDRRTWALMVAGALLMIISFTLDPMYQGFALGELTAVGPDSSSTSGRTPDLASYVPGPFPVAWFIAGCGLSFWGLVRCFYRAEAAR